MTPHCTVGWVLAIMMRPAALVQLVSRVNWPLSEVVRETSPGMRVTCEHGSLLVSSRAPCDAVRFTVISSKIRLGFLP